MFTVILHRHTQTQGLYTHLWVRKFMNVCLTEAEREEKEKQDNVLMQKLLSSRILLSIAMKTPGITLA